jgi:enamine deaminase RidA (YjgF/YER057c/UK114 family)
MENLKILLEENKLTFDHVLKATIYLKVIMLLSEHG